MGFETGFEREIVLDEEAWGVGEIVAPAAGVSEIPDVLCDAKRFDAMRPPVLDECRWQ